MDGHEVGAGGVSHGDLAAWRNYACCLVGTAHRHARSRSLAPHVLPWLQQERSDETIAAIWDTLQEVRVSPRT